jgi:hypothetical protein
LDLKNASSPRLKVIPTGSQIARFRSASVKKKIGTENRQDQERQQPGLAQSVEDYTESRLPS